MKLIVRQPRQCRRSYMAAVSALVIVTLLAAGCASSKSGSIDVVPFDTTVDGANHLSFDPKSVSGVSATIAGSGSTFQSNYDNATIELFTRVLPSIKISYAGGGSGQGKTDLADGVVEFAGTDSIIKPEDLGRFKGKVLYFPTVVAPITVSYNLQGVDKLKLDGPTLAKIFSANVTSWNDPSIVALNGGTDLPATPITVCRRADASGTTTNFSQYLVSAGGSDWALGSSDKVDWPVTAQAGDGNGGVAQCINGKQGAIGYVDLSDAKSQKLTYASIKNRSGNYLQPTLEGASKAAAGAKIADDLTYSPINTTGAGAYPITSPTWIITMAGQSSNAKEAALKGFLAFLLTDGQDASFVASVNYAPLPESLVEKAIAQLDELEMP